ncbi:hypothetical protein COI42_19515 [Priestia aryabhattai]|nr:hypothetical protein COI42_19515 [Priestia aryabhattai]
MITEAYLSGQEAKDITLTLGRANKPDADYTWESQTFNLADTRRTTWRTEGESHGYRLEITGQGSIPVGVSFTIVGTGR